MAKPLSLIIAISPRSGSYFFSDLLAQCGLPFGDEWLAPFHRESRSWQYRQNKNLPLQDYLSLLSQHERHQGLFVMKCSWPQFDQLQQHFPGNNSRQFLARFSAIFPNPRFVILSRKNQIAQAVSHLKARQTGMWVRRREQKNQADPPPPTAYSFLELTRQLRFIHHNYHQWSCFFKAAGISPFSIAYEDLATSPQQQLQHLFHFLDLHPTIPPSLADGRFIPTKSPTNQDWHQQFLQDQKRPRDRHFEDDPVDTGSTEVNLPESLTVHRAAPFSITLHPPQSAPIPTPYGNPDGSDWLRVCALLEGPAFSEAFQQEFRPDPHNAALIASYLLPRLSAPGNYQLTFCIARNRLSAEQIRNHPAKQVHTIHVQLPPHQAQCRQLFHNLQTNKAGWVHSSWFGSFMDHRFPWIYHADHEWLFVETQNASPDSIILFDPNMGWLQTDPRSYPTFCHLESGQFLRFLKRDNETRSFLNLDTNTTLTAQTNRPEHLPKTKPSRSE